MMSLLKHYARFCVRPVRYPGPAILFCWDLEYARRYARRYSCLSGCLFEVYLTSVYYG